MSHQQHDDHGLLVVRSTSPPSRQRTHVFLRLRVDEAGLYLSLYKSFEHKSPDMIKERVDKDHDSILRAALTSVSKVNKVDVEMLRGSFGVGHSIHNNLCVNDPLNFLPSPLPTSPKPRQNNFVYSQVSVQQKYDGSPKRSRNHSERATERRARAPLVLALRPPSALPQHNRLHPRLSCFHPVPAQARQYALDLAPRLIALERRRSHKT